MPEGITEWEFTADVASTINLLLEVNEELPFSGAKCEQRGRGSAKRRDLTLLGKDGSVVLTGEVKLPFRKDGGSPYNAAVVEDARRKAKQAGSKFFFTWNVNELVLWETEPEKPSWREQDYKSWTVTNVHKPAHLEVPAVSMMIHQWLARFLHAYARILRGIEPLGHKLPDERFVEMLESHLTLPANLSRDELLRLYQEPRSRSQLDKWMRDEQGWLIQHDPEGIRDNLDRAARFACYALVNKLVFHEALLKGHKAKMGKLAVPEHMDTGEGLRLHLEGYFKQAQQVTGDYETVFGEEHLGVGNRIPFYSDAAVPHWRALIAQIHDFDFSKLDYEVIGSIFERLISPEERRKYGQFYTRVEVVDLINSFCIHFGHEKVMDPACGGGTFLVRAYARKRNLDPSRKHAQLLSDLFGVDVEHFATHLTTINLAARNLVDEENYPQIARSDFFDVGPKGPFLQLPSHSTGEQKGKGTGKAQHRQVQIPPLDAVIANPPYVRQEQIPSAKRKSKPERGTKESYHRLVKKDTGADLSGRSDLHCYFWPHASTFLKDHGYMGLLTSSQWLDVEYGFKLQQWVLENFEIVAILESIDEPWFVGARVATAVTILRRQQDEAARMNNLVRFVQLREPIREILANDGTTADAVQSANEFRNEILSLDANAVTDRYRARVVRQGDLWRDGVKLGVIMDKSKDAGGDDPLKQTGDYYGGKWGVHLRAPDLWFDLLDEFGDRFCPLGDIADVWRGVTSGKDCFFFPKDCSAECLAKHRDTREFATAYGVQRHEVESGEVKLVLCGEGLTEIRPIEAKYLQPEVHTLMEVDGFSVGAVRCGRHILLASSASDKYVSKYVAWGEEKGFHTGSTCSSRAGETRAWYDVTGHKRGAIFWSIAQQYKHVAPLNEDGLICNHNLFDVSPRSVAVETLAGVLNSSWTVLSKYQYGRPVGVEGNLKTEVIDVKMMLVPDPTKATPKQQRRVAEAFNAMKGRKALQFLSERRLREMAYSQAGKQAELKQLSDECELDMPDRRALDHAVLQMMGVGPKKRRDDLIFGLHEYLWHLFESVRSKEEKAIVNKRRAKRRGPTSVREIATQIYETITDEQPQWLRTYEPHFLDTSKPFDTYDLPSEGRPEVHADMYSNHEVRFRKRPKTIAGYVVAATAPQAELLKLLAENGTRDIVRVPHEEAECVRVTDAYRAFLAKRSRAIRDLIAERTADEDIQEKILQALMVLLHGRA